MKRSFLVLLFVVVLLLAACGGNDEAEPAAAEVPAGPVGDAANGSTLYQGTCIACHGADAKGLPNLGKDLTISTFVAEKSDSELVEFLKVGRPASDPANTVGVDMPPRGGNPALTDQNLADIVAYIRSIHE